MACTIKYNGVEYSESDFIQYIQNNPDEFQDKVSYDLSVDMNSGKFSEPLSDFSMAGTIFGELVNSIEPQLSEEFKNDVASKYGINKDSNGFKDALQREISETLKLKKDNEILPIVTNELIKSFSSIPQSEIDKLSGMDRSLYNLSTNQNTYRIGYPQIKGNEIAYLKDDGTWAIFDRDTLIEDLKTQKIDVNEGYGVFAAVEEIVKDKVSEQPIHNVDYSKILSDTEKSSLSTKLFGVLEKLGFSTTKLSDYMQSYKLKHGLDPSVNAIADMVNKVVAVAEGREDLLTEEVAHVLTEAYNNQDEIRDVLPEVENTDIWSEHSAKYFKLYEGKGLTGDALTEKVRREIFGKIISEKISELGESNNSTLSKISNIVNKFFNSIRNFLKPSVKNKLDELTTKIAEASLEEEKLNNLFSSENLNQNPFEEFYNAEESTLTNQLDNMVNTVRKATRKTNKGALNTQVNTMSSIVGNLKNNSPDYENGVRIEKPIMQLKAISQYLSISNSIKRDVLLKINNYEEANKEGKTPKTFLNSVDNASVEILATEVLPHLRVIKESLASITPSDQMTSEEIKRLNNYKKQINTQIESLLSEIGNIKGKVIYNNLTSANTLIESMINEYNINEQTAQEIRDYLKMSHRDVSMLQMFFGNMQHAPNPILGLFSRLIGDLHHKTDTSTNAFKVNFLGLINKLGISQNQLQSYYDKIIQKSPDGKVTGFLKAVIDWNKFEVEKTNNQIGAYNTANSSWIEAYNERNTTKLTFIPISDLNQIGTKPNFPKIEMFYGGHREKYDDIINTWREENLEYPYNESFRKKREDMLWDIRMNGITLSDGTFVQDIPQEVEHIMANWALERNKIKSPYMSNGVVEYSKMSKTEKDRLDSIKGERLEAKSLVSSITGELKTDSERNIALGLLAIEQYYINQSTRNGQRKLKEGFIDKLRSFTDNKEAFNWFERNSGLTFNDKFWKKSEGIAESVSDKFQKRLNNGNVGDPDIQQMKIDQLKELLFKRTQFLKQFKNPSSPIEIDTSIMSRGAQEVFLQMEQDIQKLFQELNTVLKDETGTEVRDVLIESTTNEAFERDFNLAKEENPGLTLLEFAKNHMTQDNYDSIVSYKDKLKVMSSTGVNKLSNFQKTLISRVLGINYSNVDPHLELILKREGNLNSVLEEITKSKVSSYYKRFAPKGFTEFYNQLKSGNLNTVEAIEAIANGNDSGFAVTEFVALNPEVEWMEDENQADKNPNFIEESSSSHHYGGYGQPKMSKYINQEFINEYNIDLDKYRRFGETISKGTSPEKQKELELSNFLLHQRYDNFKQQDVDSYANAYSLPGVRKPDISRTKDFMKNPIKGVKQWYEDEIENSIDKKIYGETSSGEINSDPDNVNNLIIPTLNVRPLERLEDTSTDLFYSYATHTYNANLFKNRQDALTKANQLEAMLLSKDFKNKAVQNSKTYDMFKDFKKAYIFGMQETQRIKIGIGGKGIDLTNILRTMDRALGTINVGLNPAVSFTAGTSALTFSATEALVGQYINASSYKKGIARFHSKIGSQFSESGKINKTNELYLFGERFGLNSILQSTENSGENVVLREMFKDGISGMAHFMTEIATKPFAPSAMYAVMDDFRYMTVEKENEEIKYELVHNQRFKEILKKQGLTKSEIDTKWKSLEKYSILNNIFIENGQIKYSQELQNIWSKIGENAQNSMELDVKNMLSTVVSKVDAKMPLHDKSMASRNALARFVLRHREWFTINVQNRFKRQHRNLYTGQLEEGHYHTLGRLVFDMFKAFNPRNDTKVRDLIENLSPVERMNLRRVLIDTAISMVLIAFGSLVIRPWGDDEENKDNWNVQFLAYMYYRLANEQMSSGVVGVPAYKDVLEAPIVAVNSIKEIMKPSNWSMQEVERGAYEGHSKLFKLAAKNSFLRHYYDLTHGLQQKSDFYRLTNEWTLFGMSKISKKEREEQQKEKEELRESYAPYNERFVR